MTNPTPDSVIEWLFASCPSCHAKLRFRGAEATRGFGKCPACGGKVVAAAAQPLALPAAPTPPAVAPRPHPGAVLRALSTWLRSLLRDVYSFPWRNPRVWLLLAVGMTAIAGLGAYGHFLERRWNASGAAPVIGIVVYSAFVIAFLWLAPFGTVIFLAVVQDTSSGGDEVIWPDVSFVDRLVQLVRLAWIALCAAVPLLALAIALRIPPPAGAVGWGVALAPLVLFFPLMLLGAMSNDTWSPWNGDVLLSVLQRPLALMGVWLVSAALWFASVWLGHEIIARFRYSLLPVAGPFWAASFLIYSRLLGRLARLATRSEGRRRKRKKTEKPAPERGSASTVPPRPAHAHRATVVFRCPSCRQYFEVPRDQTARACTCPHCQVTTTPERAQPAQGYQETKHPSQTEADPVASAVRAPNPNALQPHPEEAEDSRHEGSSVYGMQPGSSDARAAAGQAVRPAPAASAAKLVKAKKRKSASQPGQAQARWTEFTYPILLLFLLPLLAYRWHEEIPLEKRLQETVAHQPQEVSVRVAALRNKGGQRSLDGIFALLPENRLDGALLPRRTWLHWGFALASAVLFAGVVFVIFPARTAPLQQVLLVGLFTASAGLLMLFVVQYLAMASVAMPWFGSGPAILINFVLKLIGFSYLAALNPNTGFVLSALGFTVGVGFCEELCKAFPMIIDVRHHPRMGWQGYCRWGLASGIGLGVAEGIRYSAEFYNGVEGAGTYAVRFVSCVALHGIWTAAAGIMLYQRRALFRGPMGWREWPLPILTVLAVPMILHGLYDTLLKKEMLTPALIVAFVSFAWLAFLIERMRRYVVPDEPVVFGKY
jgi:hypothetical protein